MTTGCGGARIGGSSKPDKVIDQLRIDNRKLEDEVARLNKEVQARLAELAALRSDQGIAAPELGGAEVPRLHEVAIASLSGAVDTDGDGRDDLIRLYVVTRDQHGRTLPVEARAVIQAVRIEPGEEPATIAARIYEPREFRDTYRSGIAGTHFTLELQLPSDQPADQALTVKVSVTDAATGITLAAQRPIKLRPTQ